MALTLTKVTASQCSLKYTYSGTGSANASITAATLIADCAAGPLKDFLQRVNAGISSVTWGNLVTSKPFSIYVLPRGTSGATASAATIIIDMQAAPNALAAFITAGGDTVNGEIELRYHPSVVR